MQCHLIVIFETSVYNSDQFRFKNHFFDMFLESSINEQSFLAVSVFVLVMRKRLKNEILLTFEESSKNNSEDLFNVAGFF